MVFSRDPSEDTPYSRRVLSMLRARDAVVPEVWPYEIANSVFVSFNKRKRITEPQIREFLERLKPLPIRIEPYSMWGTSGWNRGREG